MIPVEVTALAGEVLKMMLLSELKITTAVLLMVAMITVAGTSLTGQTQPFQEEAGGPDRRGKLAGREAQGDVILALPGMRNRELGGGPDEPRSPQPGDLSLVTSPPEGQQEDPSEAARQARPRRRPEQTRIIGLVVDEEGRSVTGAIIRLIGGKATPTTTCGPDGAFTLVVDEPALHHHLLHASADEGARQGLLPFPDTLAQPETTAKVVLKSAKSLTVRVIDRKGTAVPDAFVEVPIEHPSSRAPVTYPLLAAQTDAQGLARLRIPADAGVPNVIAFKRGVGLDYYEGYRSARRARHLDLMPLPETITLALAGARTVRVRALNSARGPVPNVEISPWQINIRGKVGSARPGDSAALRMKTDAQGVATFDFLPLQLQGASFTVRSEALCSATTPLSISADELERELTFGLLRNVSVSGRVIGVDGRPAAGILLQADGRSLRGGSLAIGQNARTGTDGTFRFMLRPEMSSMIAVIDERWAAPSKSGILTREGQTVEGIEFRLIPGTVIRGRATVGPENQPAADQTVTLIEQGSIAHDARGELLRTSKTDAEGRYQFRVGPGEYTVSLPPLIASSGTSKVGAEPEIIKDFAIEKPPLLHLAGVVIQKVPGGRPAAGAIVEGRGYGTNSGRSTFRAVSDARGQFTAERYRDAMVLAARTADDAMAGIAFITADDERALIPVAPAAEIRGRITDPGGKPFAGTSVFCRIAVDPPDRAELKGLPLPSVRQAQTDADGRYTIAGIPINTRCTLLGRLKIGDTWHQASGDVVVTQSGPISAPDLMIQPRK
jgi:hypothetical protein